MNETRYRLSPKRGVHELLPLCPVSCKDQLLRPNVQPVSLVSLLLPFLAVYSYDPPLPPRRCSRCCITPYIRVFRHQRLCSPWVLGSWITFLSGLPRLRQLRTRVEQSTGIRTPGNAGFGLKACEGSSPYWPTYSPFPAPPGVTNTVFNPPLSRFVIGMPIPLP